MRSRLPLAAAALAGGALLAACGGSSSSLANDSASQIASTVSKALHQATAVHITGTVSGRNLDLHLYKNAISGTLVLSGQKIDIISTNPTTVYLKGSAAMWQQFGQNFGVSAAQAQALSGKWVKLSNSSAAGLSSLTLNGMVHSLSQPQGKLSKVGTKTINGQSAVGVHSTKGGTMWVPTTGTADPIELVGPNGQGTITFSEWNQGSPPAAPSGALNG